MRHASHSRHRPAAWLHLASSSKLFLLRPRLADALRLDGAFAVAAYIEKDPETGRFLDKLTEFLDYLLPQYEREHKSYLSIGIGCTGGRHRSVYIAERLSAILKERGYPVRVSHRDAARQ